MSSSMRITMSLTGTSSFKFYPTYALAIVGFLSLAIFIQSFRSHPGTTMKNLCFIFSPIFADIIYHVGLVKSLMFLLPIALTTVISTVVAWVLAVSYVQRKLILWFECDPEKENILLGRPLLFPSRLTHARMFPEKYHYWINYFLVGIPVGLRGRVGGLMSMDSDGSDPHSPASKSFRYSLITLLRKLIWFRIDTSLYLNRGDGHLSLNMKLEHFLKNQGEDPSQYPYAYLITIPQFLWWTKSPISYWYLYSPSKELSGIIMEINNSYGEKKNAFCRLVKEDSSCFDKEKACEDIGTVSGRGPKGTQSVRFTSSAPTAKYYKGRWEKDIFASPFEKVEGGFALRFMDPLDPAPEKGGPLHSNMTLISTSGKAKISSRLFSIAPPIDPLLASSWELATFLLSWSFVIPVSIGRIVVEALRIRFRGNMPYLNKPDVKRNNIPRNASEIERVLEQFFRIYLSHLVDECPFPLTVIYTPAKSLHLHPTPMHSQVKTLTSAPRPILMIQPLTPQFYTNILKYPEATSGFATEMENIPHFSDPVSQRLWVSDSVLVQNLIDSAKPPLICKEVQSYSGSVRREIYTHLASRLTWRKKSEPKTFMDAFTESNCSTGMHRKYKAARMHCYLTESFAWGSYRLAAIYHFLLCMGVMWLFWKGLWWMHYDAAEERFEDVLIVLGTYFVGVQAWSALNGCFYQ